MCTPTDCAASSSSREDEHAARSVGVHVVRHRLIAFVLSGFLSGIAGVLLGHFLGTTTIAAPAGVGDAILALIMLLIIRFRPKGIAGGRELTWPFKLALT